MDRTSAISMAQSADVDWKARNIKRPGLNETVGVHTIGSKRVNQLCFRCADEQTRICEYVGSWRRHKSVGIWPPKSPDINHSIAMMSGLGVAS